MLGNTGSLVKAGYNFDGWNTQADGNGTSYCAGATFAMPAANVTLYAVWEAIDYTVTYDGNSEDSTPRDPVSNVGDTVTVLGNTGDLVKAGYNFDGWNTQADGSGIMPPVQRSLYRRSNAAVHQSGKPLTTR